MSHNKARIPRSQHRPHPAKASHHLTSAAVPKQHSTQQAQTSGSPHSHAACPDPFLFTPGSILKLGRGELWPRSANIGLGEYSSYHRGQPNQHPPPSRSKHWRLQKVMAVPISLIESRFFIFFYQSYGLGPMLSMRISVGFVCCFFF